MQRFGDSRAGARRPYRGRDRRSPHALPSAGPAEGAYWLAISSAAVGTALAAFLAARILGPEAQSSLRGTLRLGSAGLLLGTGLLSLVRWRLTGSAVSALVGLAALLLGGLSAPLAELAPLLHAAEPLAEVSPWTHLVVGLAALLLTLRAALAPSVIADLRPARLLLLVVGGVALGVVGLLVAANAGPPLDPVPGAAVALAALAPAWLGAAVGLRRRLPRVGEAAGWAPAVLLLLAVSDAARARSVVDVDPWGLVATCFVVTAGAVGALGAGRDLRLVLAGQGADLMRLSADLEDSRARYSAEESERQDRLHDVRSVLSAVSSTTATLRRYEDRLDPGVRRRLEEAVTQELGRLQHLLDPSQRETPTDVDLVSVLDPVVVGERESGTPVHSELPAGLAVRARPHDVATIVQNLLVNARRHAAGSPVELRAEQAGDTVRLVVADRGPGIPAGERDAVFARGVRGRGSGRVPGSGLGLHTARRLAEELDGSLTLADTDRGARFVLTLPASRSRQA